MADGMERGYSYHAMFIYNKPKLKNNRHKDQDFEVSFKVVKFAVDKLASLGIRQTYYHDRDALPGSNIFGEFFDTVKASRFTVVVLTRGFLNDCWGKYKSQAAFTKLLEQDKSKRFIALNIDLEHIPDEFSTMNSICFSANWQHEDEEWERFIGIFTNVTQPVQDTGPDRFPVTHNNSGSQNAILNSRGTLQHPRAGLAGNNPLVGMQDTNPPNLSTETNPPNYPRANSILETDEGPHDPPETTDNLQQGNLNTTKRSDNGNPSNQQSDGGNQDSHGFSVTQSNDSSIIYQRNNTNGLDSNNSASVAIATNPTSSSTTTASQHVENSQSTTQTGVGLTSSVATPPNTVMSTTGNNMEKNIFLTQGAQAVASTATIMQTSDTRAQAVASTTTTMQTSDTRAQAVASTSTTMQTSGTRPQAVSSTSTTMQTSGTRPQAVSSTSTTMQTSGTRPQAVSSTSTTMETSGTRPQAVSSTSTTMQTSGTRMPPDGAATLTNSPAVDLHIFSDTNLKNIVGRDNGDEDYPSSSLNRNDVEPDNNGESISNSTDNQVSTDSLKTETKNGQVCSQQTDHTKRFVCPKDGRLNSQHDSGYDQRLNFDSIASDHQDTNGFNTESIGVNRLNDYSALLTNNSDGYESMDGPATNSQGASLLLSTMRRMLPGTKSTMRNTMGTMIKPIAKFVQKCDQSYF